MDKNFTDNEIFKILKEFQSLEMCEKFKRLIGKGSQKSVYLIPNTDYVIKEPHVSKKDIFKRSLIADYIGSKKLNIKIPIVETPILVVDSEQNFFLIQKLLNTKEIDKNKSEFFIQNQLIKNKICPNSVDVYADNIGIDNLNNPKILDVGRLYKSLVDVNYKTKLKNFKKSIEKIKNQKIPRIFR